jgi:hypothetical protein
MAQLCIQKKILRVRRPSFMVLPVSFGCINANTGCQRRIRSYSPIIKQQLTVQYITAIARNAHAHAHIGSHTPYIQRNAFQNHCRSKQPPSSDPQWRDCARRFHCRQNQVQGVCICVCVSYVFVTILSVATSLSLTHTCLFSLAAHVLTNSSTRQCR